MNARDRLAATLGPEFTDIIVDSHREALEDGVRMGLGMAVQAMEGAASLGSDAQKDALNGCADGLREISAGFSLEDSPA